jgi:phosphatidylserine decarboxylase
MKEFSMADPQSQTAFPVARAGYPFLYAAAFATAVFALLDITGVALIGLLATVSIALFFRDPDRMVPAEEALVVAPADGKVVAVERVEDSPFYEGPCTKVGIFMSVFNVHINRVPHEGRVTALSHRPGRFLAANRADASLANEHNAMTLETKDGQKVAVVQIAGWVARRIICSVVEGEAVNRGQRFGLICFGSRVDLYLPPSAMVEVAAGARVKGGASIIGRMA